MLKSQNPSLHNLQLTPDMCRCSTQDCLHSLPSYRQKLQLDYSSSRIFRQCCNIEDVYKPDVLHLDMKS